MKKYQIGVMQMKIPKVISKNNREYIFVKEYPGHISYQDTKLGIRESFSRWELGYRTRQVRDKKINVNYYL